MGNISTYLANKLLDHIFGNASYSMPTIYIALSTSAPGDTGSTITEPVGNNYSRIATSAATWNDGNARSLTNNSAITFLESSGSWGTITHYALFDASSGGNFLGWGSLDTARTIGSGTVFSFPANSITVSL